jgi:hypothetical protein
LCRWATWPSLARRFGTDALRRVSDDTVRAQLLQGAADPIDALDWDCAVEPAHAFELRLSRGV